MDLKIQRGRLLGEQQKRAQGSVRLMQRHEREADARLPHMEGLMTHDKAARAADGFAHRNTSERACARREAPGYAGVQEAVQNVRHRMSACLAPQKMQECASVSAAKGRNSALTWCTAPELRAAAHAEDLAGGQADRAGAHDADHLGAQLEADQAGQRVVALAHAQVRMVQVPATQP